MRQFIHYLIQHPSERDGLIYPTDLNDNGYYSLGSFYIMGSPGFKIRQYYSFHAVHEEETIEVDLFRFRHSRNFYQATFKDFGTFLFYAQPVKKKQSYVGRQNQMRDLVPMRRLIPLDARRLDHICEKHSFYFTGYSPRIGG